MRQDRIIIADDHPVFRDGLARLIQRHEPEAVIEQAATVDEALSLAGNGSTPSTFILDLLFSAGSLEAHLPELRRRFSRASIIVVSMIDDPDVARRIMGAGADGFICKSLPPHEIVAAVAAVRNGDAVLQLEASGLPVSEADESLAGLTLRQVDVLRLLSRGLSNKEIGLELDISPFTVRVHVSAVLKALGVTTRAGAAAKATACGLGH
ncbi:LuxR C-terminal-related transcriptional regulator [Nitratireductor indicus]|uniref:LuxR family transcriptional regulator n=1 Tax=Nitratireductor indicus C115 TaxID=1231190 RepID=K2PM66_9HYPH|nr:response regulator transcription factor [Nitratireductor indicus]EKF42162.1 LuxR family transcriptional regulator [Nitratireductor indicus C115]MDS1136240.1 response regulator transcription factor [Nitratireductor indicus]SFQ61550.1 DNA-binding response regulator, NarL/FixJ family, contains REC and HTH domains [Nitratireductor indicus]